MVPCVDMRLFLPLALLLLTGLPAVAADLSESAITAEYGPTAPAKIVRDLQARVDTDIPQLVQEAIPAELRGHAFQMDVEQASRGVKVHLAIEGSSKDANQLAKAISGPLEDLVHEVGGDYSAQVSIKMAGGLSFPTLSLPAMPAMPKMPVMPQLPAIPQAVAFAVLAGIGAIIVAFVLRRGRGKSRKLPLPTFWGFPVLGLLPESLVRVGKLYHLQSKPCQAMGYFFLQQAQGLRQVAITAPTPEAGGTVAVCLGLFLVREGEKVLLVDVSGDSNVVPSILARFGTPPDEASLGSAQGTSIADLDLMSMPKSDGRIPDLPAEITGNYNRLLFVLPPGASAKSIPAVDVVTKPSPRFIFSGRQRVGWVFFGDSLPLRVSDRYYTRYYYEKLNEQAATT